ncbi:MAG: hypothetical protein AB1640_01095 [bacterium]
MIQVRVSAPVKEIHIFWYGKKLRKISPGIQKTAKTMLDNTSHSRVEKLSRKCRPQARKRRDNPNSTHGSASKDADPFLAK